MLSPCRPWSYLPAKESVVLVMLDAGDLELQLEAMFVFLLAPRRAGLGHLTAVKDDAPLLVHRREK